MDCCFQTGPGKQLLDTAISDRNLGVTSYSAVAEGSNDTSLELLMMTDPDALIVAQQSISKSEMGNNCRIKNQFRNQLLCMCI